MHRHEWSREELGVQARHGGTDLSADEKWDAVHGAIP
jgi:hypothetical protein